MKEELIGVILAIVAWCMAGCAGEAQWTYKQASGAGGSITLTGELLTKTDSMSVKRADGSGMFIGKSDQSVVPSAIAWGMAAGAAGKALDGSVTEVIDAVKK